MKEWLLRDLYISFQIIKTVLLLVINALKRKKYDNAKSYLVQC